jgi:hypothetical protein
MKSEHKWAVLKRLQSRSWMVDAGWSPEQIAAHYQAERDHRAAIKMTRRAFYRRQMQMVEIHLAGRNRAPSPLTNPAS